MASILRVERDMQSSHKKATRNRNATADLASRAARHSDLCSWVASTVSEAQDRIQYSLKAANGRMANAEEKMAGTNAASQLMADQAKRHDKKGRRNKFVPTSCPPPLRTRTDIYTQLFWMTFLIPIVNVATTLHSLAVEASVPPLVSTLPCPLTQASDSQSRENNQLAESYRTAAAAVTAEHTTATAEKQSLEAARSQLHDALKNLSLAQRQAKQQATHAEKLMGQARALTDKYGIVTARLRDVVRALGCLSVGEEVNVPGWEQQRALGLMAIKEMLVALRAGGMLKAEGEDVLERLEGMEGLKERGGEWGEGWEHQAVPSLGGIVLYC